MPEFGTAFEEYIKGLEEREMPKHLVACLRIADECFRPAVNGDDAVWATALTSYREQTAQYGLDAGQASLALYQLFCMDRQRGTVQE